MNAQDETREQNNGKMRLGERYKEREKISLVPARAAYTNTLEQHTQAA